MQSECFICSHAMQYIVFENKSTIAFLDMYPKTKGYTHVAVKRHIESITQLNIREYLTLQSVVYNIATAIEHSFKPEKISIFQVGGFVSHLHFHVVPVYEKITKATLNSLFFKKGVVLPASDKIKMTEEIKKHLTLDL